MIRIFLDGPQIQGSSDEERSSDDEAARFSSSESEDETGRNVDAAIGVHVRGQVYFILLSYFVLGQRRRFCAATQKICEGLAYFIFAHIC